MEHKALPLLETKDIATKVVIVDGHTARVEVLACVRFSINRHRRTVHVGLAAAGSESARETVEELPVGSADERGAGRWVEGL